MAAKYTIRDSRDRLYAECVDWCETIREHNSTEPGRNRWREWRALDLKQVRLLPGSSGVYLISVLILDQSGQPFYFPVYHGSTINLLTRFSEQHFPKSQPNRSGGQFVHILLRALASQNLTIHFTYAEFASDEGAAGYESAILDRLGFIGNVNDFRFNNKVPRHKTRPEVGLKENPSLLPFLELCNSIVANKLPKNLQPKDRVIELRIGVPRKGTEDRGDEMLRDLMIAFNALTSSLTAVREEWQSSQELLDYLSQHKFDDCFSVATLPATQRCLDIQENAVSACLQELLEDVQKKTKLIQQLRSMNGIRVSEERYFTHKKKCLKCGDARLHFNRHGLNPSFHGHKDLYFCGVGKCRHEDVRAEQLAIMRHDALANLEINQEEMDTCTNAIVQHTNDYGVASLESALEMLTVQEHERAKAQEAEVEYSPLPDVSDDSEAENEFEDEE